MCTEFVCVFVAMGYHAAMHNDALHLVRAAIAVLSLGAGIIVFATTHNVGATPAPA